MHTSEVPSNYFSEILPSFGRINLIVDTWQEIDPRFYRLENLKKVSLKSYNFAGILIIAKLVLICILEIDGDPQHLGISYPLSQDELDFLTRDGLLPNNF